MSYVDKILQPGEAVLIIRCLTPILAVSVPDSRLFLFPLIAGSSSGSAVAAAPLAATTAQGGAQPKSAGVGPGRLTEINRNDLSVRLWGRAHLAESLTYP